MNSFKMITASCLISTALTSVAQAQQINYDALESIFGEPVTTSATGKPQRASDAPVSMEIIGAEEIRRSGARDIPQLLQKYAGVQVNRGTIGRADVSLRGYAQPYANRTLVLVNGRQVLQDAYGQTPWERLGIQMTEIRQIELVRGPNSALFGFNAEDGVINIITYNPLQDDVDVAEVKFGTQMYKEGSIVNTQKLADNMAVRLSAGVADSDGYNRDQYGSDTSSLTELDGGSDDAHTRRSANIDYAWQLTDTSLVRAQVSFANGATDHIRPFNTNKRRQEESVNYHLDYKKESDYGLWTLTAYRNSFDAKGAHESDLNVLKAENLFKVGSDHTFRVAGEYRHNTSKGIVYGGGDNRQHYELWAPSAMWDWQVNDHLAWTTSVRYDLVTFGREGGLANLPTNAYPFDRSIEEISYNTGLRYKVDERNSFRFSAGRGLHIPSLIEIGASRQDGANLYLVGNPNASTERNTTVEVGYDHKFADNTTKLSASLYWKKVDDVISEAINHIGPDVYVGFGNVSDSSMWGLELSLNGVYNDWFRWGTNYTYSLVDDERSNGSVFGEIYYEEAQPEHQISVYGGFDHGNWEFDADLNYVSSQNFYETGNPVPGDTVRHENVDPYFVLNARVGYNWSDATSFELTGYNLVDKHREWQRTNTALGYGGAETIGRTVLLGLRHKF